MYTPIPVSCITCMFRVRTTCRRHPPQSGDNVGRWPYVSESDRCGEWEPSDAATRLISIARGKATVNLPSDPSHRLRVCWTEPMTDEFVALW